VTVEVSVHKATVKKEMAMTTVKRQALGPISEPYVKLVSNKPVAAK
jgi:non-homologous end joining protein Ku